MVYATINKNNRTLLNVTNSYFGKQMHLWLLIMIYFQSQIKLVYVCICFGMAKKPQQLCCFFLCSLMRIREGAQVSCLLFLLLVSCWVIPTWAYPATAVASTLEHYWPPSHHWIAICIGYNHLPWSHRRTLVPFLCAEQGSTAPVPRGGVATIDVNFCARTKPL